MDANHVEAAAAAAAPTPRAFNDFHLAPAPEPPACSPRPLASRAKKPTRTPINLQQAFNKTDPLDVVYEQKRCTGTSCTRLPSVP